MCDDFRGPCRWSIFLQGREAPCMSWNWRHGRAVCLLMAFALSACSKKQDGTPPQSEPLKAGQSGVASWYGHPFDGRQTANGEIYDMEKLTAAHRTYAFGTVLHVTNQSNGKTVDVKINDRGPFVAGRIIDLSHGAAQTIAMPSITHVTLTVVSAPAVRGVQNFAVQTGAFATRTDAEALMQRMQAEYGEAKLIFRPGDRTWRVLVGALPTIENANTLSERVGKEAGPSFPVMLDDSP